MASTMESISTINSFLRTILAMFVIGAISVGSWFGYQTYNKHDIAARKSVEELATATKELEASKKSLEAKTAELALKTQQIQEQEIQIATLKQDVDRLATSLALMKVDHRLAKLTVIDQGTDESNGQTFSLVEFVELNDEGNPIDTPREFRVRGDLVYIDNWIVKFDDKYVESADLERGTSLILFHRIFGDKQQPAEGFPLDEKDKRPKGYAHGKETDLEKKIWADFWNIANNEKLSHELGIRAAHGGAVSMKVQKGKAYRVIMRSTGDLSIVPEEKAANDR